MPLALITGGLLERARGRYIADPWSESGLGGREAGIGMTTGYSLPICDEERGPPRRKKKTTTVTTLGKGRISSLSSSFSLLAIYGRYNVRIA